MIIYDNFGLNDTYNTSGTRSATTPNRGNPPSDNDVANAFLVPTTSDFLLDSIELAVWRMAGANELDAWITEDIIAINPRDGSYPRGEPDMNNILEHFRFSNQAVSSGGLGSIIMAESVLHPLLKANSKYWLAISVPEPDSEIAWYSSIIGGVHDYEWIAEKTIPFYEDKWRVSKVTGGFAFRISGTSVPEPSTFFLLGIGLTGVGFLRRRFKN
jgi:hypothetical protein